jgi:hypothetical protein
MVTGHIPLITRQSGTWFLNQLKVVISKIRRGPRTELVETSPCRTRAAIILQNGVKAAKGVYPRGGCTSMFTIDCHGTTPDLTLNKLYG